MEKTTEYNKQYLQKKTDSCHVPILDSNKGKELGYEYSEVDDTGHKWYSLGKTLYKWYSLGKTLQVVLARQDSVRSHCSRQIPGKYDRLVWIFVKTSSFLFDEKLDCSYVMLLRQTFTPML